ncbi:MAG: MFS transporter [archaeon]|nr:MFS transporter [archaeon]
MNYYSGIERDAKLLIVVTSLVSLPFSFLLVIQPIYLGKAGIDATMIGALYTAFGLASSTLVVPFGILSDRYGRKLFLILGIILQFIFYMVYVLTIYYPLLLIFGIIGGIGNAMFYPSSSALLAEKSSEEKRTLAFSLSFFASTFAYTFGALLSGLPNYFRVWFNLSELFSYRTMFAIATIFLIFSFIPLASIKEVRFYKDKRRLLPIRSLNIIAKISLVDALIGLGAGFIIPLFSLWFYLRFGLDEVVLGPLFAITNGVMALSYLTAPKLSDYFGIINSIVLTISISTGLMFAIPFMSDYGIVAILFVFRNFLMNVSNPISISFMMNNVAPEERGSATGITGVAWNLPYSITSTFGGYIMANISLYLPFLICGTLYAISITLFYGFFRRFKPKREILGQSSSV